MRFSKLFHFWSGWGIVPRLMGGVGLAIILGGSVHIYLDLAEDAAAITERYRSELTETFELLAPLIADQAILGGYDTVQQLLQTQVKRKRNLAVLSWTDEGGGKMSAQDPTPRAKAPAWFADIAGIHVVEAAYKVQAGGVGYGTLHGRMAHVRASNLLWDQFVKQLQVVSITLLLMLQFMWLIFRGNLGTLRMLAIAADRFSHGDHAARVEPGGAPEIVAAAVAFNKMAANIENLIGSLGESERNNRRLAAIVQQSSEAIWTSDLDGSITTWNPGAAALFGFSAEEALGNGIKLDQQSSPAELEARQQRLLAGETFSYEIKAVTKAGREIDIEIAVAPLYDESGVVGKIAVAHDVTVRNSAEQELRAAREAAEAANKAKSGFLARMSHEIRTPMNGMLGMAELLLETELTQVQRRYAEAAQRSGKTLLGILNDILDFSKIEAGKLELEHIDFDVRQVVEDTVELLAERAQSKGVELTCMLPVSAVTRVKGDPLRLGQVLLNLVGNAVKFTDTGEVAVAVKYLEDEGRSVRLHFEVCDTGPGISEDAQGRIFENFSQADGSTTRKHGGTGLGLAISRQLIEMMGGNIKLKSTVGVGSKFSFALSLEKQDAISQPARTTMLDGIRALIVVANATTRSALHAQIGDWGMHTRSVDTPEAALEVLRQAAQRGAPYDLVIVDSAVAGMGAMALAQTIKGDAALANARLVLLMPAGRHRGANEARQAGFAMCLSKPVRQSPLHDCLVTVMLKRGEALMPSLENASSPPARHRGGRLLVAEDNIVNQQVAIGILDIEGCEVTIAKNGAEAIEMYSDGNFDLVLMDCHMPEVDGFAATRRIRELERANGGKRIPVIALTANAMTQDREECLNAGMDDHLSKPYTRMQMRAMLERWLPSQDVAPRAA